MNEKSPSYNFTDISSCHENMIFSREEIEDLREGVRNQTLADVEKIIDEIHIRDALHNWPCNVGSCIFKIIDKKIKNLKSQVSVGIPSEQSQKAPDTHSKQFRYPKGHNWEGMTPEEVNKGYSKQDSNRVLMNKIVDKIAKKIRRYC